MIQMHAVVRGNSALWKAVKVSFAAVPRRPLSVDAFELQGFKGLWFSDLGHPGFWVLGCLGFQGFGPPNKHPRS